MTADERLALIRVKVERAKQHIRELEPILKAFVDSRPYALGTKEDTKTKQRHYYIIRGAPDPPRIVAAITGDVFQNLRSALDHLAYQLVVIGLNGVPPADPNYIAYPIADSATKYPSLRDGKVKGARRDAIQAIDATKPYRGGTDDLWRLHKLNNLDKHRLLISAGFGALRSLDVGGRITRKLRESFPDMPPMPGIALFLRPSDPSFGLKDGEIVLTEPIEEKVDKDLKILAEVALHEPGIIESKPLVVTLQHMADLVDNLISSFKPLLA